MAEMSRKEMLQQELAKRGLKTNGSGAKSPVQQELQRRGLFGKEPPSMLESLKTGFLTGVGNTGAGVEQILGTSPPEQLASENAQRQAQYNQSYEANPWSSMAGNVAGGLFSTAPIAAIPGLGPASIAARLGLAGRVAAPLAGGALSGGAQGALGAASQYVPEGQSRLSNAMLGGGLGAGLGGAIGGASGALNAARPSNALRGSLSPNELMANVEAARGTETGLGDILGSPGLKGFQENILSKFPLSGASGAGQRTAQTIKEGGGELFQALGGGASKERTGSLLKEGLDEAIKSVNATKNSLYDKASEEATRVGVTMGRDNFSRAAKDVLSELGESSELAGKFPSKVRKEIETYARSNKNHSISNTNKFRGLLGEEASKAFMAGEKHLGGVYLRLKDALTSDMDMAINNSPSDSLRRSYDTAQKFYKENVVPLEAPEITKFSRHGGDPDTILSTFFKPGRANDRSILLEKLTGALGKSANPEDAMNALRSGIFSRALDESGNVNPNKMAQLYKNLGEGQKQLLFAGKESTIPELEKYSKLVGMNQEPLSAMFNPKTGHRLSDALPLGGMAAGATVGSAIGGPVGVIPGAFLGAGGLWGPRMTKYLTSPQTREELIRKMINPKQKSEMEKLMSDELMKALTRGTGAGSTSKQEKSR